MDEERLGLTSKTFFQWLYRIANATISLIGLVYTDFNEDIG
jgi:hypothetical protein